MTKAVSVTASQSVRGRLRGVMSPPRQHRQVMKQEIESLVIGVQQEMRHPLTPVPHWLVAVTVPVTVTVCS